MKADVAIVGTGPAGVAAAVQLTRMGLHAVVLEKGSIGGLMRNARQVENYPGFPEGISGRRLAGLLERQLRRWKVPILRTTVTRVTQKGKRFRLDTARRTLTADALVLACGSRGAKLGIPGEAGPSAAAAAGRRIFYEVAALPRLRPGQRVAVIGSGDIAFDYALSAAEKGAKVRLLLRGTRPKCLPLLWKAVRKAGIGLDLGAVVKDVSLTKGEVRLAGRKAGKRRVWTADYVLVAAGRKPDWTLVPAGWRKRLRKDVHAMEKSGLFLAGDMNPENARHVGIAVGDGLRVAMAIGRRLGCP